MKSPTIPLEACAPVPVVEGFHALSDPLRVQIVELLRHQELCVCDLCDRLQVKQSKLSFHLKILKQAGLIQGRQEGRWVYYRLELSQFWGIAKLFVRILLRESRLACPGLPLKARGTLIIMEDYYGS